MKKVIILAIVLIGALSTNGYAIVTEGADNVNCGYTGTNETGSALMKGFYADQSAASSRVSTRHDDFPTTTIGWDLTCNATFADCTKWNGYTLSGSALSKTEHFYFPIPGATCPDGGSPWGQSDTDSDGISDICDPYPAQSITFDWRLFATYENSDVMVFKIRGADGSEVFMRTGGDPPANAGIVLPSSNWMDDTKWSTMVCGESAESQTAAEADNPLNAPTQTAEAPDTPTESPEEAPSGETDEERIAREDRNQQDIVTNTAAIAAAIDANRKRVGDVHSAVLQTNEKLADIENQIKKENERAMEAEAEKDSQLANLDSQISGTEYPDEYDSEEIPEEPDSIGGIYGDFINNNPVADYINNSGLQASGSCSFTWDYNGKIITFSACPYEDVLGFWGNLIVAVSALYSLIIIARA